MKKLTLDQFVNELKADVDRYKQFYLQNKASFPEQYPDAMDEEDWITHFLNAVLNGDI